MTKRTDETIAVPGERIARPKEIDRGRLRELMAAEVQLVEVLPREEYEEMHLPGAVNISLKDMRTAAAQLDRWRPVVVYCHDYQ